MTETIELWERQPGETEKEWTYFQAFKALSPPRSLKPLSTQLGKCLSRMRKISAKWKWYERVEAWERRLDRARDEVILSETERAQRGHVRALLKVRELGELEIDNWLELARSGEASGIKVEAALKLVTESVKLERLIHGQATDRIEQSEKWDLSKLSVEDVQKLRELKRKASSE